MHKLYSTISIHVPLAGNVLQDFTEFLAANTGFLSTFPLRGTSLKRDGHGCITINFYPRSPCGERPGQL